MLNIPLRNHSRFNFKCSSHCLWVIFGEILWETMLLGLGSLCNCSHRSWPYFWLAYQESSCECWSHLWATLCKAWSSWSTSVPLVLMLCKLLRFWVSVLCQSDFDHVFTPPNVVLFWSTVFSPQSRRIQWVKFQNIVPYTHFAFQISWKVYFIYVYVYDFVWMNTTFMWMLTEFRRESPIPQSQSSDGCEQFRMDAENWTWVL